MRSELRSRPFYTQSGVKLTLNLSEVNYLPSICLRLTLWRSWSQIRPTVPAYVKHPIPIPPNHNVTALELTSGHEGSAISTEGEWGLGRKSLSTNIVSQNMKTTSYCIALDTVSDKYTYFYLWERKTGFLFLHQISLHVLSLNRSAVDDPEPNIANICRSPLSRPRNALKTRS